MGQSRVLSRGMLAITAALAVATLLVTLGSQLAVWKRSQRHVANSSDSALRTLDIAQTSEVSDWQRLLNDSDTITSKASGPPPSPDSSDDALLTRAGDVIATQLLGQYVALKQSGTYTENRGERIGISVAQSLRYTPSFERYTKESLVIVDDTSYKRALVYRSDMREALAPLLENRIPEFDLFARYIATGDVTYLSDLEPIAARYNDAAKRASRILVPDDAADRHVRVINALLAFASVLEAMARHGADPFASAVLTQTYNNVEREVLYAFDALATYYVRKHETNI